MDNDNMLKLNSMINIEYEKGEIDVVYLKANII